MREQLPPQLKYKEDKRRFNTGRPKFQPTDEQRRMVQKLAPLITRPEIAAIIGINENTLAKYFLDDLNLGKAMANSVVGEVAFNMILKGNVDMTKFWLARRMGWVEQKEVAKATEDDDIEKKSLEQLQAELQELQERKRIASGDVDAVDEKPVPEYEEAFAEAAD